VLLCSSLTIAFLIGFKSDRRSSTSRKKFRRRRIDKISSENKFE